MRLFEIPIAHRGLHDAESPENSMSAFIKAVDAGYNIETDVHLLKDGKLVAFHDSNLSRMLPGVDIDIEDLSSEDLKSDKYLLPNGEKIPLFEELVDAVDGKVDILCEIKSIDLNHDIDKEVYRVIKDKPWIAVQSFNPLSVLWFKKNAPYILRGQLSADLKKKTLNKILHWNGYYPMLNFTKPDFFAYCIEDLPAKSVTAACKRFNMRLISWTVKSEELVNRAKQSGVENIIFEDIRPDGYSL